MANLDHEAIRKAYPDAVNIDDGTGAFKADGTKINLVQSDIDAARVELDKLNYRIHRVGTGTTTGYIDLKEQLDQLYRDINAGKLDTTGTWATHIKAVKDANPKPS